MKKHVVWSIIALGLSLSITPAEGQNLPVGAVAESHHKSDMAVLMDGDVALSMYGKTLTWGDLKRLLLRDGVQVQQLKGVMQDSRIRDYIQSMVRRVITLREAQKQNLMLTTTERADYYLKYKQQLEQAKVKVPFQEYIKKYPRTTVSLFEPCFDDLLLIAKFNELLIADVTVTDAEVADMANRGNASTVAVDKFNTKMREDLTELLSNPDIKTDEGFAKLAREHSEGTEAAQGGMMGVFPRGVVASACGVEDFDYGAGETTPVLETKTAFRIVRVHEVIPPQKEGEDEKVRISQILKGRFPEQEKRTDEQIKASLLKQKQIEAIKDFSNRLIPESQFSCPLFPKGLYANTAEE